MNYSALQEWQASVIFYCFSSRQTKWKMKKNYVFHTNCVRAVKHVMKKITCMLKTRSALMLIMWILLIINVFAQYLLFFLFFFFFFFFFSIVGSVHVFSMSVVRYRSFASNTIDCLPWFDCFWQYDLVARTCES